MSCNQTTNPPKRKRPRPWRRWVVLLVCAALLVVGLLALWAAGNRTARTQKDALDLLLENCPALKDAVLIETEDCSEGQMSYEPAESAETSDTQQSSTELSYAASTPREALDLLLESYPMLENAFLIETEDFLGWKTPYIPVGSIPTPDAQQSSTQLCYYRLTPNEKYYEFWLYSSLLDVPSAGIGHRSTLNFYAVNIYTGEILIQRTDAGMEYWRVYYDAIAR